MRTLGQLFPKQAFLAVLALPLSGGDHWHALRYGNEPANEITFSDNELRISVKRSASPLFYHFDETLPLHALAAEGSVSALPTLLPGKTEGEKGADDFALRLGVVLEGKKSLNWFERLFAPSWLKRLTDSLPNRAFGGVHFLTLSQSGEPGDTRHHPMSHYLFEDTVKRLEKPGPFAFEKTFEPDVRAIGLWIQSDGDDTQSTFDLRLTSIALTTTSSR